ncbi:hypothetical protein EIKCOROL_00645 [Eikenella corrodens ATCC 23834]|uniref:Uncharacterized protein n=1 Tax=Eikenella corrodens ATCC 23834 TaxID=546274 RepID=C0DTG6_EIKCO|nr:hypothetical protein EIKCOROL_00645 [Eikenella corrodens ATCC 23834]
MGHGGFLVKCSPDYSLNRWAACLGTLVLAAPQLGFFRKPYFHFSASLQRH